DPVHRLRAQDAARARQAAALAPLVADRKELLGVAVRDVASDLAGELREPHLVPGLDRVEALPLGVNPRVGAGHEPPRVPHEQLSPRRVDLATRGDVVPTGELDPHLRVAL